jgi:hypothetical protein
MELAGRFYLNGCPVQPGKLLTATALFCVPLLHLVYLLWEEAVSRGYDWPGQTTKSLLVLYYCSLHRPHSVYRHGQPPWSGLNGLLGMG